MQTRPLQDPKRCEYERVDDNNHSYACDRPAVVEWLVGDYAIPVCRSCREWIETLEQLESK